MSDVMIPELSKDNKGAPLFKKGDSIRIARNFNRDKGAPLFVALEEHVSEIVLELQLSHEKMTTVRSQRGGHLAYDRFRTPIEILNMLKDPDKPEGTPVQQA